MPTAEARIQQLIARLEPLARRRPRYLRARVAVVALLGYFAFGAYLLLLLLFTAFAVFAAVRAPNYLTGLVAFGGLLALWYSFAALRVKVNPPEGVLLTGADAAAIQAASDELSTKLRGPRIHEILLTTDYNAGMSQVPRLGIFGWQKNYLSLGFPLLCAMPAEEFRAILAHEFGHLSGNHGRFSGWLIRVRGTWVQLTNNLETRAKAATGRSVARGVIAVVAAGGLKFLNWYRPLLEAHWHVLNRSQEYSADRAAAALVGAPVHARALTRLQMRGSLLSGKIWPQIWLAANTTPEPREDVYSEVAPAVRGDIPEPDLRRYFANHLREKTQFTDTHPCYSDRMAVIGYSGLSADGDTPLPQFVIDAGRAFDVSAAEEFFGSAYAQISLRLSQEWRSGQKPQWKEIFEAAGKARETLAKLEAEESTRELSENELVSRANAYWTLSDTPRLRAATEAILKRFPENPDANMGEARHRLSTGDASGLDFLERAISADMSRTIEACQLAQLFCSMQGDFVSVAKYRIRERQYHEMMQRAQAERKGIVPRDTLLPHDITPAGVERMKELFAKYPLLEFAYLARKNVRELPGQPYYIVGLRPYRRWYKVHWPKKELQLLEIAKRIELPTAGWVVLLTDKNRWLRRKFDALPDSQIYRRE